MKNTITTRKEVSCKFILLLYNAVKEFEISSEIIFEGISYDKLYLLDHTQRVEWDVWCKILNNLRPFFTPAGFELLGYKLVHSESYSQGFIINYFMFFSGKLTIYQHNTVNKLIKHGFSPISYKREKTGVNTIKISIYVEDGYQFIPEFFYLLNGGLKVYCTFSGKKNMKSAMEMKERGADYIFTWDHKPGILFILKRFFGLLLNLKKSFTELTEAHEQFLEQYKKLDESKQSLQKQTMNLRRAYELSRSLWEVQDLEKALSSITKILLRDTDFSAVCIKLLKDGEGNNLKFEIFEGQHIENLNPHYRKIVINNREIGELTIWPKLKADNEVLEELLDYMIPVINISIYNSLVLRTITDYKNNLEAKVEKRTSELIIAQNELSETVCLLKKAQQAQSRFFTNISHEFRTPLTLIEGPAGQILEVTHNKDIIDSAKLIRKNAGILNRLVDQLLDLSRIEAGKMRLKARKQNLIFVIREVVSSFESFAESKSITLKFHSEDDKILLYLDREKIEKIFSNLLSNALKFTSQGGEVKTNVKKVDNFIEISISDTGIGIPHELIGRIFDRFFQIDNQFFHENKGTGVGLSLTKELVEIHKGRIAVESEPGKGSTFTVLLPVGKDHLFPEEICEEGDDKYPGTILREFEHTDETSGNPLAINSESKPLLLIIEDNSDVRKFVRSILGGFYNICESSDGQEGFHKALESSPDLIISDIMMPKMDGLILCDALKKDARTSHIPLILLTAKAANNEKIEGLEKGADDYITKPFEADELKVRIKNLLEQRKRIYQHFQKYGLFELDNKSIASADQKFLKRVFEVINLHISDSCFSVEMLAESSAMSRSLLHKKLTTLVGESPGDLIKRIRLNTAARLLEQKYGNVTEVAFEVGFDNPSYFGACFKNQFGVSPTHYIDKNKKD